MSTYVINGMGGAWAAGVPSLQAARSLVQDELRYDDRALDDGDDYGNPVTLGGARCKDVEFVLLESEFREGTFFTMAYLEDRQEFGIHLERRCPTCCRPDWDGVTR